MDLILASTSPYRRRLMERLHLDFQCISPDTDETTWSDETPPALAQRLALLKARSVAIRNPRALVIGCDQVATLGNHILSKPGNFETAMEQLKRASGREVHFYTGIALVCINTGIEQFHVEPFSAKFRALTDREIEYYLRQDEPYDCAGSFKVESLGIALFESLRGSDPTSLEGLPLITLTTLLASAGIHTLGN